MAQIQNTATFFEQWHIYQSIIQNNYMFHQEIVEIMTQQLDALHQPSVLDLGCGDSYVICQSVPKSKKLTYVGVDLAQDALNFGVKNWLGYAADVHFICNDFLNELSSNKHKFDVIVSGYTLHHLSSKNKQKFLNLVAKSLNDNGVFIFYDTTMKNNEKMQDFNERMCAEINNWKQIKPELISSAQQHVKENDQPENAQFFTKSFAKSGFNAVTKKTIGSNGLFSLYLLRKS